MTRTILLTALSIAQLFAAEPYLGVWKLDLAKSTFSPGPPPTSQLLRLDGEGGMVKLQLAESSAAGTAVVSAPFRFDGKPYPVQASKMFDSVSATLDPGKAEDKSSPELRTRLRFNWMRNGTTQVQCNAFLVGSRLTISTTGTGPDAKPVKNYRVFVKEK